jgi:GH15 family glucan-1,4-alpha-glucosidase
MPRDIPVGNGKLLVCFDQNYAVRDLYFPHVGQENHVGGRFLRFGVWVENRFSWIGEDWERMLRYLPDTLVTQVTLQHQGLAVRLDCQDVVDYEENIYLTERARNEEELNQALEMMNWVVDHALPSGVLAEQIHPFTGQPVSVSPLTWSHATFVASTQHIMHRLSKMKVCPACGSSLTGRSRSEDWVEQLLPKACDAIYGMCEVK